MRQEHELACDTFHQQKHQERMEAFPPSRPCGTSLGASPTIVGDFAWHMPLALSSNTLIWGALTPDAGLEPRTS